MYDIIHMISYIIKALTVTLESASEREAQLLSCSGYTCKLASGEIGDWSKFAVHRPFM